jgi:hypothetical protein
VIGLAAVRLRTVLTTVFCVYGLGTGGAGQMLPTSPTRNRVGLSEGSPRVQSVLKSGFAMNGTSTTEPGNCPVCGTPIQLPSVTKIERGGRPRRYCESATCRRRAWSRGRMIARLETWAARAAAMGQSERAQQLRERAELWRTAPYVRNERGPVYESNSSIQTEKAEIKQSRSGAGAARG